jgi:hypothetical protein
VQRELLVSITLKRSRSCQTQAFNIEMSCFAECPCAGFHKAGCESLISGGADGG